MRTKVFSMFSGVGGFELGLLTSEHNIELVGLSEIDKYASQILKTKFKGVKNYGDAKRIVPSELPQFDLLVGGFPCQAFSVAGLRRGWNDTRGTLFFDIARILRERKPKYILLENVKGLLSHNNGRTFQTILEVLSDIGYMVQWEVLNSKNFGVPQNRERVYIVGHLRGERRPEVFPFRKGYETNSVEIKRLGSNDKFRRYNQVFDTDGACETIDASGGGGHTPCIIESGVVNNRGTLKEVKIANCIDAHYANGMDNHQQRTMIKTKSFVALTEERTEEAKKIRKKVRETSGHDFSPRRGKQLAKRKDGLANCVTSTQGMESYLAKESETIHQIRKLTPLECERLQGFPDNWTEELSNSQRYKCMGNAVTVNVVKEIANRLLA